MKNFYCRTTLFAFSALWICVADARADERQLEAVTCGVAPGANLQAFRTWKDLELRGRPVADGQFALEGRIREGAVCVENVSVTGAFGVLIVVGEVCKDSTAAALSGFVRSKTSDLKPADNGQTPGVISSYRSASRSILIFKGDPSPEPKPDASSSRVSYVCTHQSSGPQ